MSGVTKRGEGEGLSEGGDSQGKFEAEFCGVISVDGFASGEVGWECGAGGGVGGDR